MSNTTVSIHPYFKAHPGKLDEIKAHLPLMIAQTASEPGNLFYDFTIHNDEVFCREAYANGAGALAHLANIGELLGGLLKLADLYRIEIHGAAAELEVLKEPLAALNPVWFELACGVIR